MSEPIFVGREAELSRMNSSLETAGRGEVQVLFVVGEAGAGKSSLVTEFVKRAEEADSKLISAIGKCNAQTGISDPYLPFRQVLTSLTTEENIQKAASKQADKAKRLSRWKEFVRISSATLISLGPDLIGIFVPGARLLARVGTTIAFNSQLASKLSEKVGKKDTQVALKPNPALDQQKIFEQYTNVLKALSRDQTLVLIIDDLQWADNGSLSLLFHLARELKDSHILIVGTYRPDDVALGRDGGRHPLEPIVNELKRYNGEIILDLSESEAKEGRAFVDALIDSEPNHLEVGFRDELFAHTGGHPLFTVELLRDLQERGNLVKDDEGMWIPSGKLDWEELPARIEGVIDERIARLPIDLHETATVASVFGYEFAAQIVAVIQKANERELLRSLSRELEKRYLLVAELGEIKVGKTYLSQYRFSHVLLQQYLYDEVGTGERRMLHAEIAEKLEALYADQADEIALQLAHHFEAAGEDEKAVLYLIVAGNSAFRVYAYKEAMSAYTRALDLGEKTVIDTKQLNQIYLNRGRALELINKFDDALKNYDEMLAVAQKQGDLGMELAAKVATSTLYSTPTPVANADKGQTLSEETLKLADELGDRAAEAKVLWNLQLVNLLQTKANEAIDYGEKSLSIARELNLREQMAYTLSDLGWAYNISCDFEKAKERTEEATFLWRELDNKPMLANNLNQSIFRLYLSGDNAGVLKVAEESFQISSSIGEIWNQASARSFQGQVLFEVGEVDQAIAAIEESIHIATEGGLQAYEMWYRANLLRAFGELNAVDLGMQIYQTYQLGNKETIPRTAVRDSTLIAYALFEIFSGQLETAAETLAACSPNIPTWETYLQLAKSRLALAHNAFSEGLMIADSAVELASKNSLGQYLPEALFLKGKAHFVQGNLQEAKLAFEQARSEASKLGSRRLLWQILAYLTETENNNEKSEAFKSEARENIDYIASHISNEELRAFFLKSNAVSAILG